MKVISGPLEGLLAGLRLAVDRVLQQVHGVAGSGSADADAERLSRVSDWDAVAALAGRHGVVGLFLHGLHARPELAGRPAVGALRRLRDRRFLRSGRRLRGLQRAAGVLADAGVDHLVLKGVPLSRRLYGHPLLRSSADVDLLVAPADAWPAEKALLRAGCRRHSAEVAGGPGAAFRRYLKHRALVGPDGLVELHHRLVSNPSFLDVRFEDLWAGRETVRLGSASFAVLGADDDFLYNTCHALRHGWADLKWLCDAGVALGLAAANPGAFERLRDRFRAAGLHAALECVALLCREHLHVRLPARLPAVGRSVFVSRRIVGRGWSKASRPRTADRARGKAAALLLGPGVGSAAGELASMAAVRLAPAAGHPRVRGLRAFVRAPAATRRMALEAAFFLLAARLLVAYAPGRQWRRWAEMAEREGTAAAAPPPNRRILPSARPVARRVGRIVPKVAAGAPFEAACLPQALAARWMLRRRGVASRLSFGVRRPPGADLQVHAWLTTEGDGVVGCREAETYRVFTVSTTS